MHPQDTAEAIDIRREYHLSQMRWSRPIRRDDARCRSWWSATCCLLFSLACGVRRLERHSRRRCRWWVPRSGDAALSRCRRRRGTGPRDVNPSGVLTRQTAGPLATDRFPLPRPSWAACSPSRGRAAQPVAETATGLLPRLGPVTACFGSVPAASAPAERSVVGELLRDPPPSSPQSYPQARSLRRRRPPVCCRGGIVVDGSRSAGPVRVPCYSAICGGVWGSPRRGRRRCSQSTSGVGTKTRGDRRRAGPAHRVDIASGAGGRTAERSTIDAEAQLLTSVMSPPGRRLCLGPDDPRTCRPRESTCADTSVLKSPSAPRPAGRSAQREAFAHPTWTRAGLRPEVKTGPWRAAQIAAARKSLHSDEHEAALPVNARSGRHAPPRRTP